MLTLDLIQEEDTPSPEATNSSKVDGCKLKPDNDPTVKSQSLPRKSENSWTWNESQTPTPRSGKKLRGSEKSRCASMDEILAHSETKRSIPHCSNSAPAHSVSQLQQLISLKLGKTQELLTEARGQGQGCTADMAPGKKDAERLLEEAACTWGQARDVLEEVKGLKVLCKQLQELQAPSDKLKNPQQNQYRKSMM